MAGPCEASRQTEAGRSSTSMTKNTVLLGGTELVIKFQHHYPPSVYGVRKDGTFSTFRSPFPVPVFFKTVPKKRSSIFRSIITNFDLYARRKKRFIKEYGRFKEDVLDVMQTQGEFIAPAKFVTECFLYDYKEWAAGAPRIEINQDTGERVTVVKAITPDALAIGRSFCSMKEQNYSRKIGRELALKRAKEQYERKFV